MNKSLGILVFCLFEGITSFGEIVEGITRPWNSFGVHDAIVTRFTVNGELCLTLTNRVGLSNWSQADLNGNPICLDYYNQLCYEDGESSPSSAFRDIDGGPWSPLIDYTLNYDSEDKSIYYIFTGWKGSDGNFVYGMDCPSDEQEVFEAQFINWTETLSDVSSSVAGMYDGYDATLGPIDKISACLATRYDNVVTYEGQTFEDWENCHDGISDRIIMAGKKPVLFAKIAVCHVLVWDSKAGRYYQNEKTVSLNATLWIRKCPGTRIDSRIEKPYYRKIELGAVPVKFTKENSGDKLVAFAYEIPDILPVGRYQYHFEFNSDRSILEDDYTNNSQGGLFDVRYPDFKLRVEPIDANEDSVLLRWRVDDDMLSDQASDEYLESCWRRYNVWRGTGETDWDFFDAAELIGRNRSFPYFVDNKFGKVPGVKPVRYWVEKFTTASSEIYQNPTNTPEAYCDVRRSPFGVAMEKVDGQRILALTTIGSDVFWDDAESKAGVSRNSFTATRDATPFVDDSIPRCYVGIAPESGGYAFEIKAPASWTLTSDSAWLRPSKGSGVKGSSVITVQVGQNVEAAIRKGRLTFFCDGGEWVFDIVQDVMPKVLDWNLRGKDTEKEQDRVTGDPVGDPCLVADGRLVVKLQFSHFNRERYRIESLKLSGVPNPASAENPAKNDIFLDWQKTMNAANPVAADSTYAVELVSDQKLPKGVGCHGLYDFTAEVSCERIGRINVVDEKCPVTKKVFFDKYKRDNGSEPNWFVYWSMDGAVPALVECSGKYSTVEGAHVIHRIDELDELGMCAVHPSVWGSANCVARRITLYDRAACEHYFYSFSSLSAGGIEFCQPWVYGIYTVANVLAHEQEHIETRWSYAAELDACGVWYFGVRYSPQGEAECEIVKSVNSDFDYISNPLRRGLYFFFNKADSPLGILQDDCLTNDKEKHINDTLGRVYGFTLDKDDVDTFDLGGKKSSEYYESGDDEFMSMLAGYRANEDPNTAIEEKDWAYPGHQSYLPLVNGQKVQRKSNKSVSGSDGVQRTLMRKMPLQIAQDETEPFGASNGVIVAVNGDAAAKGEADAVRYKLSFDVTGSDTVRFVGYLIDPASNVVACAGTNVALTADNNCCELAFPTNDIFRSGFSGPYTLSGMIVYRVCNTEYACEGVYRDLVTDWVSVERPNPVDEHGIASRYGPFVPGEKVELKFAEGAAWKVAGLPTGLKWDAKLPGVTGVPTKPGTNTVTFTWTDKSVTPNVTHKASSTFIVGPLPVLSVLPAGEGTGKVTGAGAYAANKKVTLKATADTKDAVAKGKNPATVKSVFAGWYDAAGDLVAQTPSLSYVMPPYDVALQARFIPVSNDWATADCVTEAGSVLVVSNETKVAIAPISVVVAGGSLPTVKVAGLPSGLKFTAKDILKKDSKTEVDIPANTIYGTPTKGGVYNATVTVTTAGKASVIRAIKFIIRTSSDYVADADWDPMQGKVTGVGVYQAGKKVTLKATANKGYVFSGWYEGKDLLTKAASYVIAKMPTNDVELVAAFVTAAEDKASIGVAVDGMAFGTAAESGGSTVNGTNVWAGVYLEWPVAARALSEPTVAVSGLPSGLKFTAKPVTSKVGTGKAAVTVTNVPPNTIYGAPTSASKTDKNGNVTPSKVKVTVTTAGKSKVEYVIDLTVDPLPALAQGEFSGLALTKIRKDGIVTTTRWGSASLTVGSAGKISGKMIVNGTNCTFTAASYDSFRKGTTEDDWQATATCSLKIGKQVVPMGLTVVAGGAFVEEDDLTAGLFRNSWKDKGAKPVPEEYQGAYSVRLASDRFRTGYLSLTVDKKGAVKVAGKAPDGTVLSAAATLVPAVDPEGAAYYFADIFAAPSDYKGGYVAGTVNFLADRTLSGYVEWRSYNPQSTGDYEKGGFDRALDCSGAKYDKNALLPDLGYGTLALSAFGVREELFITVDQTGKKFVVADKGDAKLTFSFTQSTGIWKGSYLMWPDPSSTKSVNVSFEGILVSGEKNLNGFGTYDATSSYPTYDRTGKKTGEKSYKFKESVPVSFTNQP